MTAPATPLERLERALAELGALTPDGIADRMRALGIKGVPGDDCTCPIAEYLRRTDQRGVSVGGWIITEDVYMTTPAMIAEFIERFDRGVYMDLVVVDGGAADE